MSLYAIGDLHLSFSAEKPMDVFGDKWENHAEKLRQGFSKLNEDDMCVICGDLSWGMGLEQTREDFLFIHSLPGKKIILKGNHDYWWSTATKAKRFFAENGIDSIDILFNNSFFYENYANPLLVRLPHPQAIRRVWLYTWLPQRRGETSPLRPGSPIPRPPFRERPPIAPSQPVRPIRDRRDKRGNEDPKGLDSRRAVQQ